MISSIDQQKLKQTFNQATQDQVHVSQYEEIIEVSKINENISDQSEIHLVVLTSMIL